VRPATSTDRVGHFTRRRASVMCQKNPYGPSDGSTSIDTEIGRIKGRLAVLEKSHLQMLDLLLAFSSGLLRLRADLVAEANSLAASYEATSRSR
jgi:hypothetical protein